jgi:hypothetical protein
MVLSLLLPSLLSCGGTPSFADGPNPALEPEMFRAVLRQLTAPESLPRVGDWPGDLGDANYYGEGFFLRYGSASGNSLQLSLATDTESFDEALIDRSLQDLGGLLDKLEDVMMASFGLIEGTTAGPLESGHVERVERVIDVLNSLSGVYDYYPEKDVPSTGFGLTTYGPSAINGGLALLNLEWAIVADDATQQRRIGTARTILEAGRQKGFDEKTGYYRFSNTRSGLDLYPNVVQMIAHLRLHQLTGESLYLNRAIDLHRAIQPLQVKGEGRYRSPYSAEAMGAKTDDYTTLSSQNYTLIALALLYRATGDPAYKQEVIAILQFLRTHLLQEGRVLHHWMDGRAALPQDKEYYCSGCNLQLLYVIWRLEEWLSR